MTTATSLLLPAWLKSGLGTLRIPWLAIDEFKSNSSGLIYNKLDIEERKEVGPKLYKPSLLQHKKLSVKLYKPLLCDGYDGDAKEEVCVL